MSKNEKKTPLDEEESTLFSAPREITKKKSSKRRLTTLLIAIAVTACLGGGLLIAKLTGHLEKAESSTDNSTAAPSTAPADPTATLADTIASGEIKNVSVVFGETTYDLVPNKDGALAVAKFVDMPRNGGAVNDLVTAYASITPIQAFFEAPDDEEIAACGLDAPSLTVTVTYHDDSVHTLTLGHAAFGDQAGYYGRLDDDPTIWLFDIEYYESAAMNPSDFVAKTLIVAPSPKSDDPVGTARLKTIALSGSNREQEVFLRYIKPDDDKSLQMCGKYVLEKPFFRAVDNTIVDSWDTSLTGLYATTVEAVHPTAEQLASYGLDEPHSKATLTFGVYKSTDLNGNLLDNPEWYNEVSYTLSLGKRTEDNAYYYAMLDGIDAVYTVSTAVVPWSEVDYDTVVNKALFLRYITDLSGVNVTVNGDAYSLGLTHSTKKDENGKETAVLTATVNKGPIDESEARGLYENLMMVKRVDVAPDDAKATGEPALTIETISLKGEPDIKFSFYPYSDTRYLCENSDGDRFLVKSTDVEELVSQWGAYKLTTS